MSLLSSAVVAAAVASGVTLVSALVGYWITGRRQRLDRQRQLFAEALAACVAYREFPYMVRRRAADGSDRRRLTTELSGVQRALALHSALLSVEAPTVARAYEQLVEDTRRVAGGEISRAWRMVPLDSDKAVSITDIDLGAIVPAERRYRAVVAAHLFFLGPRAHGLVGRWRR